MNNIKNMIFNFFIYEKIINYENNSFQFFCKLLRDIIKINVE